MTYLLAQMVVIDIWAAAGREFIEFVESIHNRGLRSLETPIQSCFSHRELISLLMLSVGFSVVFQLLSEGVFFLEKPSAAYSCCSVDSLNVGCCLRNNLLVELSIECIQCRHIVIWCSCWCGGAYSTVGSSKAASLLHCIGSDGLGLIGGVAGEEVGALLL
jgi:hypothetical protein